MTDNACVRPTIHCTPPMARHGVLLSTAVAVALLLPLATAAQTAPAPGDCPKELPASATCYAGQDGVGSYYRIALPAGWSAATGVLVMHSHGGPADTGPAKDERAVEDLTRWAVTVKSGYAFAASSYRRGGYGVTMAAEDTERLRELFVKRFGQPRRTILHGQSYGGGVASKGIELYGSVDGKSGPYDAVLLTSGVLGGGSRAYDFRLDLRVVYQYYCKNHPRADESQYPLWSGLPQDAKLTRSELTNRVDECTGVRKPAGQRTAQQQQALANILNVVQIPERTLIAHLNWATWLFRDLVQLRMGGRNPFGNIGAVYQGSSDDAALNASVIRYAADPAAAADLARDSDPQGKLSVPVLTLHAIHDPTAFVELESAYQDIVQKAGNGERLVQTFSLEHEHSYLEEPQYPALFAALLDWVDKGDKPTPESVLARCNAFRPAFGGECRIQPAFRPDSLDRRVTPRPR